MSAGGERVCTGRVGLPRGWRKLWVLPWEIGSRATYNDCKTPLGSVDPVSIDRFAELRKLGGEWSEYGAVEKERGRRAGPLSWFPFANDRTEVEERP